MNEPFLTEQFIAHLCGTLALLLILKKRSQFVRITTLCIIGVTVLAIKWSINTNRLWPIVYTATERFQNATPGIASGDIVVDRLLKDFQNKSGLVIDFPVLVLTEQELAGKIYNDSNTKRLSGIIGYCDLRLNGTRAIYLNQEYIASASEAEAAQLLAHELGHCIYFLRHSNDPKDIMYEFVDMGIYEAVPTKIWAAIMKSAARAFL